MNKISLEDSAAIVNFFEGEGTICINENNKKYNGNYQLSMSVVNTNKVKLLQCKRILGIGKIRSVHEERENRKSTFRLEFRYYEMKQILNLLINSKYLVIKKYATLAMLEWFKETHVYVRNKGYDFGQTGMEISSKEYSERSNIADALLLINKKKPYNEEELVELQKVKNYYDWWFEENYPEQCKINKEFNR